MGKAGTEHKCAICNRKGLWSFRIPPRPASKISAKSWNEMLDRVLKPDEPRFEGLEAKEDLVIPATPEQWICDKCLAQVRKNMKGPK